MKGLTAQQSCAAPAERRRCSDRVGRSHGSGVVVRCSACRTASWFGRAAAPARKACRTASWFGRSAVLSASTERAPAERGVGSSLAYRGAAPSERRGWSDRSPNLVAPSERRRCSWLDDLDVSLPDGVVVRTHSRVRFAERRRCSDRVRVRTVRSAVLEGPAPAGRRRCSDLLSSAARSASEICKLQRLPNGVVVRDLGTNARFGLAGGCSACRTASWFGQLATQPERGDGADGEVVQRLPVKPAERLRCSDDRSAPPRAVDRCGAAPSERRRGSDLRPPSRSYCLASRSRLQRLPERRRGSDCFFSVLSAPPERLSVVRADRSKFSLQKPMPLVTELACRFAARMYRAVLAAERWPT